MASDILVKRSGDDEQVLSCLDGARRLKVLLSSSGLAELLDIDSGECLWVQVNGELRALPAAEVEAIGNGSKALVDAFGQC